MPHKWYWIITESAGIRYFRKFILERIRQGSIGSVEPEAPELT